MYFALLITFLCAGRALAFAISVGNRRVDVSDILSIPDSPVKTACNPACSVSASIIAACSNDASCLCDRETVSSLFFCETCMLHFLIAQNQPAPDLRAGSNVVMGAFSAACQAQANVVLPTNLTTLVLPDNWDGPFTAVLPVGVASLYAFFGALLGISALYILSNVD